MTESQKGIRIPWSEASLSVPELFELFRDELPVLVKVTEGYHGQTDADTFLSGENLRISAARHQTRVFCRDPQNHRHLSIPVESFPARVQLAVFGTDSSTCEPSTLKEILEEYNLPVVVTVLPRAKGQTMTVGTSNLTSGLVKLRLLECYDEPYLLANSFVAEISSVDRRLTPILLSAPLKLQFCRVSDNSAVTAFDNVLQDATRGIYFSRHGNPTHIVTYPGDEKPRMTGYGPDISRSSSGYAEGAVCLPHTAGGDYIAMESPPVPLRKQKSSLGLTGKKPMPPPKSVQMKSKFKDGPDENNNQESSGDSDSDGYEEIDPDSEPESPELPPPRVPEKSFRQVCDDSNPVSRPRKSSPPPTLPNPCAGRYSAKEKSRISDTYRIDLPDQNRDSSMYDYTMPDPETDEEDGYTGLHRSGSKSSERKSRHSSKKKPPVAKKPSGLKQSFTDNTTQKQKAFSCEQKPRMTDQNQNTLESMGPLKWKSDEKTNSFVLVASSGNIVSDISTRAVVPIVLPARKFRRLSDVPRDLRRVSVGGVLECLKMMKLGQYCKGFEKKQIDGDYLMEMEASQGEKMFVKQFNLELFEAQFLMKFVRGYRPKLNEC